RSDGAAGAAERDVRAPLAGSGDPLDGSDHLARRDDDPQVVTVRRNELLHECALTREPGGSAEAAQAALEADVISVQVVVASPASEARLHVDREAHAVVTACADVRRTRMWDPVRREAKRGREFVVHAEERARAVEDDDAPFLECLQDREPLLRSVER